VRRIDHRRGLTAVATEGSKGLHPAPFLALAAPCAGVAILAFMSMLSCLLERIVRSMGGR
jgi:hypothetical protein